MKFSKGLLLFTSVVALSGCGIFGQDIASSDTETSSQSDNVSEEASTGQTSESTITESGEDSEMSGDESTSSTYDTSDETSSESDSTDEQSVATVIQAIKDDVASDYVENIPTDMPITEGTFPTAYTSETGMGIQIDFYATAEVVPYGDERLANGEFDDVKVATITIDKYDSNEAAAEQISQNIYEDIGGQPVDLGYNITGYQDAGAGQIHTSWNEGRWDIATQGRNDGGDDEGLDLAQNIVTYLEDYLLTSPEDYGMGRFSAANPETDYLAVQKGNKVITIDGNADPTTLLEFATYIQ